MNQIDTNNEIYQNFKGDEYQMLLSFMDYNFSFKNNDRYLL